MWALAEMVISALFFWYNMWYDYLVIILLIPNVAIMIFSQFFVV